MNQVLQISNFGFGAKSLAIILQSTIRNQQSTEVKQIPGAALEPQFVPGNPVTNGGWPTIRELMYH